MAFTFKVLSNEKSLEILEILNLPYRHEKLNKNVIHVGPFLSFNEAQAARDIFKAEGQKSIPDWR